MVKNQFFIIIIPSRLLVLLKTKNNFILLLQKDKENLRIQTVCNSNHTINWI